MSPFDFVNSINYTKKDLLKDPEVSETKKKNTGTVCQVNTTGSWANIPISTYSNPAYDPNAESKDEEKSIPLETVAAKVISNAEANDTNAQVATIAAASDIVSELKQILK